MEALSGKVVNGKIVVEGMELEVGENVIVASRADEETFTATPEEEAMLLKSIEQLERGESVEARGFLRALRQRH